MELDEITSYCKRRGIIFPASSIYGGVAGFWDLGPIGAEMFKNIKNMWWKKFVTSRDDVVGIDGSIITHPRVWEASGHIENFTDPIVVCTKCGENLRADHVIEDALDIPADGMSTETLDKKIKNNNIKCSKCGSKLGNVKVFGLMFLTNIGPVKDDSSTAYLRPETAQAIFTNYKPVIDTYRLKPPFGIAQIGKAFRNEISPRNFLFRCREFEQAEIEYFVDPEKKDDCPYYNEYKRHKLKILSDEMQRNGKKEAVRMSVEEAYNKEIFKTKWHAYWNILFYEWLINIGINPDKLRLRQHVKNELSHYSDNTFDIEYEYSFGWKELMGNADRTQYDLNQHEKYSKEDMEYIDQVEDRRYVPYVASEPSIGIERLFLTVLFDGLVKDGKRTLLKITPEIAAYKIAVFPLMKKEKLVKVAKNVHNKLKKEFSSFYDESGSIGRRYRRQDEIGTPWCITIDYDTLEDNTVTVRDRDSMKQERVKISELKKNIRNKLKKQQ